MTPADQKQAHDDIDREEGEPFEADEYETEREEGEPCDPDDHDTEREEGEPCDTEDDAE